MKKLFGAKKKQPTVQDSVAAMNEKVAIIEKRVELLGKKVEQEQNNAKEYLKKGDRKRAAMALKKKKMYEQQQQQLEGAQMRIEEQMLYIDNAQVMREALDAQKAGAEALKTANNGMTAEDVEDIQMDIEEQMQTAKEIGEVIAGPSSFGMEFEDGLDDELDELEAALADEQFDQLEEAPSAPAARAPAQAAPAAPAANEEDDLAALEAEMMM